MPNDVDLVQSGFDAKPIGPFEMTMRSNEIAGLDTVVKSSEQGPDGDAAARIRESQDRVVGRAADNARDVDLKVERVRFGTIVFQQRREFRGMGQGDGKKKSQRRLSVSE